MAGSVERAPLPAGWYSGVITQFVQLITKRSEAIEQRVLFVP